jgi:hypothetical protein
VNLIAPIGEACRFSEMFDEESFSYDSEAVVKALNRQLG